MSLTTVLLVFDMAKSISSNTALSNTLTTEDGDFVRIMTSSRRMAFTLALAARIFTRSRRSPEPLANSNDLLRLICSTSAGR